LQAVAAPTKLPKKEKQIIDGKNSNTDTRIKRMTQGKEYSRVNR
jgi:hypothetical protein